MGSEANRRARARLVDRLEAAGLSTRVDRVGNVVGRWTPPSADPDAAPVASGSHLDSVPEGGIFDGPLGVYAALEAVRAMQAADVEPDCPVEVVSFTEEEGARFGPGLVGSSVAAGVRDAEEALAMTERCRGALSTGADEAGVDALSLHSGAAHDSMHVARATDAGMLFAPSRDGASHTPREWTDGADCAAATRVLANALATLAT